MVPRAILTLLACGTAAHGQVWLEEFDWTFTDTAQGSGWVDPFIAMMYIEGGDAGLAGSTGFMTTAPAAGTVGVTVNYSSVDNGVFDASWFDAAEPELIADNDDQGTFNIVWEVAEGEDFGFNVTTLDGINGAGVLEVVDFAFLPSFESEPCGADFNGDGTLNILDFVAFQQAFLSKDPAADCDANGAFNVLDFVCYQEEFGDGCEAEPSHKALVIINSKWDEDCIDWVTDQNDEIFENLPFATIDGQNMAALMRDAGLDVEILENANAEEIAAKIKACMPDDDEGTLTIFVSGHGDAKEALPGSPGNGTLICHDCSFFTHDMFVEAVKDRPRQVTMIMGSCGSGAFAKTVNEKQAWRQKSGFWTSTKENVVCFGTPGIGGNFAVAVLDALNNDASDRNGDGRVSLGETVRPTQNVLINATFVPQGPNPNLSNLTYAATGSDLYINELAEASTLVIEYTGSFKRPRIDQTPAHVYIESMTVDGNKLIIKFVGTPLAPGDAIGVTVATNDPDGVGVASVTWD